MRLIDADEVIRGYEELIKSPYMREFQERRDGAHCIIDLCVRSNSGKDNTIDPVKHGRWMFGLCSVCIEPAKHRYRYCPNCGARMDAGGGDTEAEP